MIDISLQLSEVIEQLPNWNREVFLKALSNTQCCFKGSEIDWEEDVPERWASIMIGNDRLVIILVDAPIAFIDTQKASLDPALNELTKYGVTVIKAPSWEADVFTADPLVFQQIFGKDASSDDSINLSLFSMWDIWYAAVTTW